MRSSASSPRSQAVPGDHLGIHAHNDTEQAVANSLAAVRAGARQIQGTLNGIGERCGNANLVSLIPTLLLKPDYAELFEIGVTAEKLAALHVSRKLDEMLNRTPDRHAPYVGACAFATKAGIHASAIVKDPETYEHVAPESVGNHRKVLVSDQAGRSNLLAELERIGIHVDRNDRASAALLDEVKEREAQGYAYEGADASFYLLASRMLGTRARVSSSSSASASMSSGDGTRAASRHASEAVVKVRVGGETLISAAEGNGPVNALDMALRKDLGKYQTFIEDLKLVDYKVRIFNGGTDAVTRVLIEFQDEPGRALVHRRRVGEHHRRVVPGADRFDDLQADERGARRCRYPRYSTSGDTVIAAPPVRPPRERPRPARHDVLRAVGHRVAHGDLGADEASSRIWSIRSRSAPRSRRCLRSRWACDAGRAAPR